MSLPFQEKITDLDESIKQSCLDFIDKAFQEKKNEKEIAEYIREKFELKEEGKWNVVIGKDFGSHVVHKSRRYGLFQVGELNILIWQSG